MHNNLPECIWLNSNTSKQQNDLYITYTEICEEHHKQFVTICQQHSVKIN